MRLGVWLRVKDGVRLVVKLGVSLGVAETLGVIEGVALGVAETDGVNDGVPLGEYPIALRETAKACFAVSAWEAVMSMTPDSPDPDQSQWPKVCENPEIAVPSS